MILAGLSLVFYYKFKQPARRVALSTRTVKHTAHLNFGSSNIVVIPNKNENTSSLAPGSNPDVLPGPILVSR